jgi:hypothetical protein
MGIKAPPDIELMDTSVYSEAKGEYTKQLIGFIVPAFHRFFMEVLQQATQEEPQSKRQLWKFQELLSQIPEWNIDKVQRETTRIQGFISCDYLEELLTAVFIAHTKVLTAIRIGNKNKRVQITIPKLDHFLHRSLSESSRLLWSSAYLFHNELSAIEKQKNHRQIEQLLQEGVQQAIRGLLPVKNILKDYLAEPDHDTDADADDEEEQEQPEPKHETQQHENTDKNSIEEPAAAAAAEPVAEVVAETVVEPAVEAAAEPAQEIVAIKIEETSEHEKIEETQLVPPTPTPTPTPTSEPVVQEPVQDNVVPSAPPTLIVETEPSVRFTDFDQVIQQRGGKTHIDYVEQDRDEQDQDAFQILDDEGEPLSDFEDLDAAELGQSDYETL